MAVVGTAGHVDHGKSTLVKALTGIDPDRLREEKERGLTIDLGFAWLVLPSGREVSIVDVPGHERFIKNMLAGAGGVDLALLVVAADEGPMPQTREHLAILDLLDVPGGIVVITKCDLVEAEYAELVAAEMEDVVRGSRLEGAPVVRVSAESGEGLDALQRVIDAALERTPPKRDLGRPRLPIDRAFAVQGFGAVVTGTLVDGTLEVGQEVEVQPGRLRARVRGLQRHRTKVTALQPGTRAAVNLSGIHLEDLHRGMMLALPGTLRPVRALDVRLRATNLLSHALAHDAGVTVLCATAEAEGKLRLLDRDELLPGDSCWAQLVLSTPIAAARGDHCVVRTSNETVAGGIVVALEPSRHRRKDADTLAVLERLLAGTPADRLDDLLAKAPLAEGGVPRALGVEGSEAAGAVEELMASGQALRLGGLLVAQTWLSAAAARVVSAAEAFLATNRLRAAAPREHVRSAARLEGPVFDLVVGWAVGEGRIEVEERGAGLSPPGHTVALSPSEEHEVARFMAAVEAGGYAPPTEQLPAPELLAYLAEQGAVEVTGGGVVWDAAVYQEMLAKVSAAMEERGTITLAEVRDLFGTSRKYAQAFLEHLDAKHITRRVGEARVLRR